MLTLPLSSIDSTSAKRVAYADLRADWVACARRTGTIPARPFAFRKIGHLSKRELPGWLMCQRSLSVMMSVG
jgi:hypothetical protein